MAVSPAYLIPSSNEIIGFILIINKIIYLDKWYFERSLICSDKFKNIHSIK